MMNVLALGLVLTSLVTAGFFSPSPEKQDSDVIVKEGHRVVVVEFEKDDGNTKVLIAPQDSHAPRKVEEKGYMTNAKEKISGKMEDLEEKIKETSSSVLSEDKTYSSGFSPREIVCDAYGKCKHKIASAIGKTKDTVAEKAHEMADKVYEVEEEAREAVGEVVGKVKDTFADTAHKASDKAEETKENMKDAASEVSSRTKDKVVEKAGEMKEGAKGRVHDATRKVREEAERSASGAKEKVSDKAKEVEEMVENASDRARQGAHRIKGEGQKELSEILRSAREVAIDILGYMVLPERLASLAGILHLMGFSAAYGMCVWVTFASSYVLARALPRHQFAMVQSKIYPVYFKAMGYSVCMALLGYLMAQKKRVSLFSSGMFQGLNLLSSLVMILVNLLYLEPRATKVMFERMKKEKEEGRGREGNILDSGSRGVTETVGRGTGGGAGTTVVQGAATPEKREETAAVKSQVIRLSGILQRLNSYSSFLNVMTLMSLTWHLVHLGERLHTLR